MNVLNGGAGVPLRVDQDVAGRPQIPVGNLGTSPSGINGRIQLATPALTGNPLEDTLYEGWLYATVITAGGQLQGLYMTKDFGNNWTHLHLPVATINNLQIPTNDETQPDYDIFGSAVNATGNKDVAMAVDPNNPNILYLGGNYLRQPYQLIRIDATTVSDPYALVAYDNSNNDGGQAQFAAPNLTTGPTQIKPTPAPNPQKLGPGNPYGLLNPTNLALPPVAPYYNLERDPNNPFLAPATSRFHNVAQFNNDGTDVTWKPFDSFAMLGGSTNIQALITIRDPLTGKARVIVGDSAGVWTGVDQGNAVLSTGIGSLTSVVGSRNGNLQVEELNDGAVQPSVLAADLAGAMFYSATWNNGAPPRQPMYSPPATSAGRVSSAAIAAAWPPIKPARAPRICTTCHAA